MLLHHLFSNNVGNEASLLIRRYCRITDLVHPPERRHINSLAPDGSCSSDTGRVLAGTRVDDGVHNNLGVLNKDPGG